MTDPTPDNRKPESPSVDRVCLSNPELAELGTHPSVPPIYPAAVYQCADTETADAILGGQNPGFAYQRDRHPNATRLAEKCRQLHQADAAAVTSSGMSSLAALVLGNLKAGDHILVSRQLYGRSSVLLEDQLPRLGIEVETFDPSQLEQLEAQVRAGKTRMAFAETIANPLLRLLDIRRLVEMGRQYGFEVAIDNTFATPAGCRPLDLGVDWVWESYSKMLNGHSDVMMGLLAGHSERWPPVEKAISTWGLSSAPFECYLAERGLTTFGLRIRQSVENARRAAWLLKQSVGVAQVHYPGLPGHPDFDLVDTILLDQGFEKDQPVRPAGNVVTIELAGPVDFQQRHSSAVQHFLEFSQIPYYPSLGECNTTLSHPCSSSHRHLTPGQREQLGIHANLIRLCFGIEPWEELEPRLQAGIPTTET